MYRFALPEKEISTYDIFPCLNPYFSKSALELRCDIAAMRKVQPKELPLEPIEDCLDRLVARGYVRANVRSTHGIHHAEDQVYTLTAEGCKVRPLLDLQRTA